MTLKYINREVFGAALIDAWQNHLGTEMDPADGKWYSDGPEDNGGLYGALTDTAASALVFDMSQRTFASREVLAATAQIDNSDGRTPSGSAALRYDYQDTTSTAWADNEVFKLGIGVDIKGAIDVEFAKVEATFKTSFEYSHSFTNTITNTKSETKSFNLTVPVNDVPTGKIYRVVMLADKDDVTIPYRADVFVDGISSACFGRWVRGKQIWRASAGDLCDWIRNFRSETAGNVTYARDAVDGNRGRVSAVGTLTATRTINFKAKIYDVTAVASGTQGARRIEQESFAPGVFVRDLPLNSA